MSIDEQLVRKRLSLPKVERRGDQLGESPLRRVADGAAIALRFARRNPTAAFSTVFLTLIVVSAIFSPVVAQHDPLAISPLHRLEAPGAAHLMGTDNLGRDVFARIIYGARTSLYVGIMTVLLGTFLGSAIGVISGYFGGWVDLVIQRLMDGMQAFPGLIFALALISILGASTNNVILAIAFWVAPGDARVMRSAVLRVKELDFISAARAVGSTDVRVMLRHLLPNVVGPLTILASVAFSVAIIAEAALSFLGLGTPPPNPSWGGMLSGAGRQFLEVRPTLALFPGFAIVFTVLSLNLIGDALRDYFDPRTRKRREARDAGR